jgi:hypothetical protein
LALFPKSASEVVRFSVKPQVRKQTWDPWEPIISESSQSFLERTEQRGRTSCATSSPGSQGHTKEETVRLQGGKALMFLHPGGLLKVSAVKSTLWDILPNGSTWRGDLSAQVLQSLTVLHNQGCSDTRHKAIIWSLDDGAK